MIKKFIPYYRPYLGLFTSVMGFAVLAALTSLLIPLCIRKVLTVINTDDPISKITNLGIISLSLLIVNACSHIYVDYRGHMMGTLIERDIRKKLFDHYLNLSVKFYDEHKIGQLMTSIINDTYNLGEMFHHGPEDIVISLLSLIGAIVILIYINIKLALVALAFIPFMIVYGFYFALKMRKAMMNSKNKIEDINSQAEDTLAGISVVKAFTNEDLEKQKFKLLNDKFFQSRKAVYANETIFYGGIETMNQLLSIVVMIIGAICIVKNIIEIKDLITFSLYLVILIDPIKRIGNSIRLYQEGMVGLSRINDKLNITTELIDKDQAIEISDIKGEIEFKNVSFRYHEETEHVLKNINLKINNKEFIAIVGPSGVGKTTICSLISRLYEVNSGDIFIDGVNIKSIKLKSLRKQISVVQQNIYLFAGTILENIRYGNTKATKEDIILAAKKANAYQFIINFPKGFDTEIGQRGAKLSGGQKQRISIARMFLKNSKIIILDEATSALDTKSELEVQKALENLTKDRTTIVIAHRLSTIKNADRIVVLTENGIKEEGTHQELIKLNGYYANLYDL